jgi:hypothetical protein
MRPPIWWTSHRSTSKNSSLSSVTPNSRQRLRSLIFDELIFQIKEISTERQLTVLVTASRHRTVVIGTLLFHHQVVLRRAVVSVTSHDHTVYLDSCRLRFLSQHARLRQTFLQSRAFRLQAHQWWSFVGWFFDDSLLLGVLRWLNRYIDHICAFKMSLLRPYRRLEPRCFEELIGYVVERFLCHLRDM